MTVIGVSIPVPEPWGSRLQQARRDAGDPLADAVPTHVTLMPPTDATEADLPALEEHLAAVAARLGPFPMTLAGTGTFRPVSPVVYVAVAEGVQGCRELEAAVRSGPVRRPLDFPYHPHVTLAHGVPERALDRAQAEHAGFRAGFAVLGFDLYHQGGDGVWRSVRRFALGAPARPAP